MCQNKGSQRSYDWFRKPYIVELNDALIATTSADGGYNPDSGGMSGTDNYIDIGVRFAVDREPHVTGRRTYSLTLGRVGKSKI